MYWHVDADVISLVVICIIFISSLRAPRDKSDPADRRFVWCVWGGAGVTVVDIAASLIMDFPRGRVPYHILVTLYYAVIELAIILWALYSIAVLFPDDERRMRRASRLALIPYLIYLALVLSNPWTGFFFRLDAGMSYARGPLFFLMIAVYALYAVGLFILVALRRGHIRKGYSSVTLLAMPLLLSAAIAAQLLSKGWLLIMPGYTVCLLLAYEFLQTARVRSENAEARRLEEVVDHINSGFSISHISPERKVETKYVNEKFYSMLETTREELSSFYKDDILYGIHPDDRERLERLNRELAETLTGREASYRFITPSGSVKTILVSIQIVPAPDGSANSYATYTDISEQAALQRRFYDVIRNVPCGICLFRWDGEELHPLIVNARLDEMLGEDALQCLGSARGLNYRHVHPDDLAALKLASRRGLERTGLVDCSYRTRNSLTGEYAWVHMRGKMLTQPDGTRLVFVSYNDVTQEHEAELRLREREKELWARYELERKRASLEEEGLLAHAIFDLTTGETLQYTYRDGSEVPEARRDAFAYLRQNHGLLINEEERRRFLELNDRELLLERFRHGETEFRIEYRRTRPGGEVGWVRASLHLLRDPQSGDVLLFEYWYDIEEEKLQEATYRGIASDNYDYVARINGKTRSFVSLAREGLTYSMPPSSGDDADLVTRELYGDCVLPEDLELTISNTLVENINRHLREKGRFQFTYRELQPDGSLKYKKITQYYIDREREIILMTREDVTELIRSETEKNELLASALEAANRASQAKSQFLSRVSHELRTPLNAIIGFMDLAKGATREQMEIYLSNSNLAARQLLSIINDVLDMSAIESGKLKLANSPFDLHSVIQAVSGIYRPQCAGKGLSFEARVLTPENEWFMGDQLRVNQILLNLLSNAVKFTETGGVTLTVSRRGTSGGRIFIRFEVADTGCGMSEEMLSRIFRPFEQESADTARKYGGSGLGLSIVGSLVSMMGGYARAESSRGKGSLFIVDLPFTKSAAELPRVELEDMSRLRVLAADDKASEREYISTVLERIGARHTCTHDGGSTLLELERAEKDGDPYTVCILDWNMPDMSGLEAAGRIRKRFGKGVVIIVVSARERYQADESARAAGANMFIVKPLFQSALFDLLSTLTGGRFRRSEPPRAAVELGGRRVLLAEDNLMNRMVAEGIIKKLGMECDSVEDGSQAVEKFTSAPPGSYDAILMDIQMPVMDGFEATRAIRASSHPQASSIQIIALTANAFNEDVARSLSNGMNAHVSKPIDPAILSAELSKAFAHNAEK